MARTWLPQLHEWLQQHHGVVTVSTLEAITGSRHAAYQLIEHGELETVMPGVYRSCHWPCGRNQLMTAACLRNPSALVAFTTAARVWKFRKIGRPKDIHVLVPHGSSPRLPGVVVHRCRRIDAVDIVERDDGIRLTSPTRTLFDCADMIGAIVATSVLEQLIDDERGTFDTHAATLTRLAHHRRPGSRTMTEVIAARPAWRAAMQSDLEARVLAEIERQGLPRPEVQFVVVLPDGRRVRFDFAWPEHMTALEVDHPFWHAGSVPSARDKRRDLKAATAGWLTVRVSDLDVDTGLRDAVADVAQVLARR